MFGWETALDQVMITLIYTFCGCSMRQFTKEIDLPRERFPIPWSTFTVWMD